MSDKKEITHEELLELVSGGSLKRNYQANLDEMMANYETINTKEEFLAGFEKRWREHIGTSYLKNKFSDDLSEEDLQECLRYINENYEYKEQIFY